MIHQRIENYIPTLYPNLQEISLKEQTFDYFSDLHMEHSNQFSPSQMNTWKFKHEREVYKWLTKNKKSDVIVVNGDTSNYLDITKTVIRILAVEYEHVIFTDGNHEHYGSSRDHTPIEGNRAKLKEFADKIENVHYLHNDYVIIDDVAYIGSNAWYDFSACYGVSFEEEKLNWNSMSNDSNFINFGISSPEGEAYNTYKHFHDIIFPTLNEDNNVRKIVVFTHTVPIKDAMVDEDHDWYALNGSYYSSFMQMIANNTECMKKVSTWCFGHTHTSYDGYHNGIHFVCHPRGYASENDTMNYKQKVITI